MRAIKMRLRRVSGASPFPGCRIGGPGKLFVNTAVEPFIARGPINKKGEAILIGAWQQDRWSNGGARGLVAAFSKDGGGTWTRSVQPFSKCATPKNPFTRASDPWISIGPDGRAYSTGLLLRRNSSASAIAAVTSINHGQTWRNFRIIKVDQNPNVENDKEAVTADPVKSGWAYIVWDRGTSTVGPTWFSRTTNGGLSWSKPKIIFNPGKGNQTLGNQIVIDPASGILYNFFSLLIGANPQNPLIFIGVQQSLNRGKTWTRAKIISQIKSVIYKDPYTGMGIRSGGNASPEIAIDSRSGRLFVVWEDARFSKGRINEVAISYSNDRGRTWSKPTRVNPPTGTTAFTPMVRVNETGIVGVSYYQVQRENRNKNNLPVSYFFTHSLNGGHDFKSPLYITGPFNMLRAPVTVSSFPPSNGLFLGDYQGLTTVKDDFQLFFSKTTQGRNPVEVFSTTVQLKK
ncbi:sialidase family protein [Marininema halotolerans]|nr:sialidase family protein [Marininema halotolerans]